MNDKVKELMGLAEKIRLLSLQMVHRAKSAHIGSSLSMADILAVLYGNVLKVDPNDPDMESRDRFILSKGHACASLYAILSIMKFIPEDWLSTFYQDAGKLAGHVTSNKVPGVEVSTGSLGHGLPIACGMAFSALRDQKEYRVFVVLSDGECDEGSVWESALFASHKKLGNLVAIIDYNKIQSLGFVKDVINLEPFKAKWESFGWYVEEIDGHDLGQLVETFEKLPYFDEKPICVIANTIKGKGVSFMEDKLLWHYRNPNEDELHRAINEINAEP